MRRLVGEAEAEREMYREVYVSKGGLVGLFEQLTGKVAGTLEPGVLVPFRQIS
jgi:hypothetical protein